MNLCLTVPSLLAPALLLSSTGLTFDAGDMSAPAIYPSASIASSGLPNSARFGASLAVSADGRTVAVGAPGLGPGHVFIFQSPSRTSGWRQQAVLSEPGSRPGDEFGSSLAISSDGSVMAVAAFNGTEGTQAFVFQRNGHGWNSHAKPAVLSYPKERPGSAFGQSIALSGNGAVVVVGLVQHDRFGRIVGTDLVYVRRGQWKSESTPAAILRPSGALGFAEAIDWGGDTIAAQDAPTSACSYASRRAFPRAGRCGTGLLAIFTRPRSGWTGTPKPAVTYGPVTRRGLSNSFGYAVSLSADGATALGEDGTLGFVFEKARRSWPRKPHFQIFSAPNPASADGPPTNPAALSSDGRTLCLGVQTQSGFAYVYRRAGGGWEGSNQPSEVLRLPSGSRHLTIATALAITHDGGVAFAAGLAPRVIEVYRLRG